MINNTANSNTDWDIVVKPKQSFFKLNFGEVWAYKDLVMLMAKRDVTSLYKQTVLGPLWMLVQPVLVTIIYTFTFSSTAKISTDGIPPVLYYLMGQTFWTYFSDAFSKTSNTFISNASVFGKVYFPRLVVPLSIIISNLVKLCIQIALLTLVYVYFYVKEGGFGPNAYCALIPFLIIALGVFGLSLGIIFSSVTTKYRDFTFLLGFAIQLLMFASCVVFPLSIYSARYQKIFLLNPIANIMEMIKYSLTGHGTVHLPYLAYSLVMVLVFMIIGIFLFNRTERSFMDTV